MNTAAVAKHLNVVESAIVQIEEWANVLFCVVKGIGARFVSKKVVNVDKPVLDNVAKRIAQAKTVEGSPRHATVVKDLKSLLSSGKKQLTGDTHGQRQLIENSIEAIESYLAQF